MYPSINIPTINISAVTGKIYLIIENLTDIIEELNKDPSSADDGRSPARTCGLEGVAGLDEEGCGSSSGDRGCGRGGCGRRGGSSSGAGRGGGRGGGEEAEGAAVTGEATVTGLATASGEAGEKRGLIDPPGKGSESPESKGFDLFRYLSGNEGLELIRLESTRQALLRAQGFLEEKKQVFISLARSRQIGK